jgi:hypothetical protein
VRLPDDDEIFNVNAVWLGPSRKTFPCRARYDAYGVGLVVFVLLQAVERRLGIPDRGTGGSARCPAECDRGSAIGHTEGPSSGVYLTEQGRHGPATSSGVLMAQPPVAEMDECVHRVPQLEASFAQPWASTTSCRLPAVHVRHRARLLTPCPSYLSNPCPPAMLLARGLGPD